MINLKSFLQNHWHFILFVPILIVVMTQPTTQYLAEGKVTHLPHYQNGDDPLMKFWDSWYLEQMLNNGQDFFYTTMLFYPNGVDLTFHNLSLPHMTLMTGFTQLMPSVLAYSVSALIIVWLNALGAYLYISHLTKNRLIGFFGACLFAFGVHVISEIHRPDISTLATIPLSLYFLEKALDNAKHQRLNAVLAGFFVGFTALIGMYIFVCLVFLVSWRVFVLLFIANHWRNPNVWQLVVIFGVVASAVGLLRVYPMVTNPVALSNAISKQSGIEVELASDLISSFVNDSNPIIGEQQSKLFNYTNETNFTHYLGYIGILLIILGLFRRPVSIKILMWMPIFAVFFILRLGSFLNINGIVYEQVVLPKFYLDQLLPVLFDTFYVSGHFQIGVALPFTIMVSYGLLGLLSIRKLNNWVTMLIVLVVLGLSMIENYRPLTPERIRAAQSLQFFEELADGLHERGAIINLPFGDDRSKIYGFHQTMHGLPHIEGKPTRVPENAFDYIESNPALATWLDKKTYTCESAESAQYISALQELDSDQFSYIILHKQISGYQFFEDDFTLDTTPPPYYEDDHIKVYTIDSLLAYCESQT